jgi:transcription initiation factor TFIIIB Brf1 subunit/transcription initiation factor TFIIB
MKTNEVIELACPRCCSTFAYLVDDNEQDEALCEYCGTMLMRIADYSDQEV